MADSFESALYVRERFPDAIAEWPVADRDASYRARDRILLEHPGRSVASDRSYCMDRTDERWPEEASARGFTHALVYEITLA